MSVQPVHTIRGRKLMELRWDSVYLVTMSAPPAPGLRPKTASPVPRDTCVSYDSVSPIVPLGTKLNDPSLY